MSLDVSLKHSECMFRHEILKVIIIEEVPHFSSPESVCSLHHQQLFQRTSPKLLPWFPDYCGRDRCRGIQKYMYKNKRENV